MGTEEGRGCQRPNLTLIEEVAVGEIQSARSGGGNHLVSREENEDKVEEERGKKDGGF